MLRTSRSVSVAVHLELQRPSLVFPLKAWQMRPSTNSLGLVSSGTKDTDRSILIPNEMVWDSVRSGDGERTRAPALASEGKLAGRDDRRKSRPAPSLEAASARVLRRHHRLPKVAESGAEYYLRRFVADCFEDIDPLNSVVQSSK